ncbi:non-heme iron oxygenase ferredoxin subunit [Geodermatophilus sp. DSM 44513]|uniref:Rieske 2Fe-2S domain-containing protein n=1 Tax=Geodermatophilus sp. DSM 44513 TaxID=1528104 RepID=UPI001411FF3B|nr:non-heme iron oxygenase ferredoxin subunit [Geodermatophilus sp. DSM 44513]WNV74121.1 non-heme iron oxygenase ferredoxin subunit [Geodermatophilus sp. DSM 44513]
MSVRSLLERASGALGRWQFLDAPSYQVEHAISLTYLLTGRHARRLQDLLHGVWLGHPLHPVLATVPIGSWTAAALLDGLDATGRGGPGAGQAARHVVRLGVVGAVASAAAGATDWQHAHDEARRVGLVHAALNSTALALYTWSLADRRRGRATRARATAAAGYAVVLAGGYLGGVLSYRHRLGSDHAVRANEPRRFVPVAEAADLVDGEPLAVDADGVPVVLVASDGRIHAVGGRCPHQGAPLGEGWLHRGEIVCPWHGSRFHLDSGEPAQGPATAPLPCYETRIDDGRVEVRRKAHWRTPMAVTTVEEASR